ncbi:hypothetical protein C8Q76DRAFT_789399 [Earliella scabrosa]|nr:hypothetical protein C8Q76DRAFT_789399 [Earliella scabrosa]
MQPSSLWSRWRPTTDTVLNNDGRDQDLIFPVEIWAVIFGIVGDSASSNSMRDMHACVLICKALQRTAEAVLYSHVSIDTQLPTLSKFLTSVCYSQRRAAAVRTLRLRPPPVSSAAGSLITLSSRIAALALTVRMPPMSKEGSRYDKARLNATMQVALERMTKLSEIEFPIVTISEQVFVVGLRVLPLHPKATPACGSDKSSRDSDAQPPLVGHFSLYQSGPFDATQWQNRMAGNTHYLDRYNITHVAITSPPLGTTSVLNSLGMIARLVSLKLSYDASSNPWFQELWPTDILSYCSLPLLQYLEVAEGSGYSDSSTDPRLLHIWDPDYTRHLHHALQLSKNPRLKYVVWVPAAPNRALAADPDRSVYRDALPHYTSYLFALYPTLKRFERAKIEDLISAGRAEYVAYVRGTDGTVSTHQCQYDPDRWSRI